MRTFLGLAAAAGIIGLVVMQKQREQPKEQASAPKPPTQTAAAAASAAPAAQPSQHWPKRALDRAADVKRQVADQRRGDETR